MNDATTKTCVATGAVVACYGIYTWSSPGTDGYIFGSVLAAVAGLGGWAVAKVRATKVK